MNCDCCFFQIVRDELVKLMGGEVSELAFAKSKPSVILLAGLQGVGKTTVCAKLAYYLKKQVHFPQTSLLSYHIYIRHSFPFITLVPFIDPMTHVITGEELYACCW